MPFLSFPRYLVALALLALTSSILVGQTPPPGTASTTIPTQGSGHDYLQGLSETVDPASGTVSLRIKVPVPQGRGLTLPFSFGYDSNGVFGPSQLQGGPGFDHFKVGYASTGGWSYSIPAAAQDSGDYRYPINHGTVTCPYYTNWRFVDSTGARYALGLFSSPQRAGAEACQLTEHLTGGDLKLKATLGSGAAGFTSLHIVDAGGTTYTWNTSGPKVEDRNGNYVQFTTSTETDSTGRTVLSWSGFGNTGDTVTVSGLSAPYRLSWQSIGFNFDPQAVLLVNKSGTSCLGLSSGGGSLSGVQAITLPNGQQYTFTYHPTYGLLTQITYPTGGWVKYNWSLDTTAMRGWYEDFDDAPYCLWQFGKPKLLSRTVSFDGVTTALTQTFHYSTTWTDNSEQWTSKTTTVTTTDNLRGTSFTTTYLYGPSASGEPLPLYLSGYPPSQDTKVPVEQTVTYQDFNGSVLKTVNKGWYNAQQLASEQATLNDGSSSKTTYTYGPGSQILEKDEYDFGQSTPSRKTVTTYQSFASIPLFPSAPSIFNRPSSIVTYDGNGNRVAESDFMYDETASAPVSPAPNNHDETNYNSTAAVARANATTITKQCFQSSQACTNFVTKLSFDETGQPVSKVDSCGNNPCSDMVGSSHTTILSYSDRFTTLSNGQNVSYTPPGNTNAYLMKIIDPLGHTRNFTYDYNNAQLTVSNDENNLSTTYLYNDTFSRPTLTTRPDRGQTSISYSDAGPSPSVTTVKQINSAQAVTSVNVMDGLGYVKQTQLTSDPQSTIFTDTTLDGSARVWKQSNPYRTGIDATTTSGTTTTTYDALGRKTSQAYPDGSVLTTAYCGPSTLVTDPTKRWRRSRTDGLGRLVEVDEPSAAGATVNATGCPGTGESIWVTTYGYDTLGNLTSVLQNGSRARSFTYDSLSRLLTSNNPEVGAISYTYDANSNVSSKTDGRNITTTYGYDVVNREKSTTYSNGDPTVTTNYDESNCLGLSPCQNVGHQTSMTDAAGSESWAYQVDSANFRSVHIDQRTTQGQTKTSSYYLDLAGNISQMNYPSGRTVKYAYDNANRPKSATDAVNGLTYATGLQTPPANTSCVASAVCYTPQGTPYAMSVGQSSTFTGLNITESFNNRLQPNEIKASSTGGNAMDITYGYIDPVAGGNAAHVFSIANNLDSARSQSFSYDQLNRIVSAQTNSTYATSPTKCWGENYTLDPWANLTAIAATTNSAYTGCSQEAGFSKSADGNNHLSGFGYDVSGNTLSDGVYSYQWNAESQLKWLYNVSYLYDGAGRRVAKTGGSPTSGNEPKLYWYGSGGEILSETSPSGATIDDFVYFGGKRVAQVANDLNLNGSFESGLANWSASGSGAATAITNAASAHSGSGYVQLTAPAGYTSTKLTTTVPISAQRGETITATGWVYRETTNQIQLSRWWMMVNGSNGSVGGHPVDNFTVGAWVQQTISATVPTWLQGPYTVTMWAEVDSDSNSVSARFDDATLNGNNLLFAEDSLGTTRVITDTSGVVCYDADFYPYGGERPYTNTCTTHYKFEGKERDAETNNDDFGARYYSNRFGRWLSSDWSAVPVAIPYASLTNPQTLNLYAMVADDPESFADLDGHCPLPYNTPCPQQQNQQEANQQSQNLQPCFNCRAVEVGTYNGQEVVAASGQTQTVTYNQDDHTTTTVTVTTTAYFSREAGHEGQFLGAAQTTSTSVVQGPNLVTGGSTEISHTSSTTSIGIAAATAAIGTSRVRVAQTVAVRSASDLSKYIPREFVRDHHTVVQGSAAAVGLGCMIAEPCGGAVAVGAGIVGAVDFAGEKFKWW